MLHNTDINWAATLYHGDISIEHAWQSHPLQVSDPLDLFVWAEDCAGLYREEGPVAYISCEGENTQHLFKIMNGLQMTGASQIVIHHKSKDNSTAITLRRFSPMPFAWSPERRAICVELDFSANGIVFQTPLQTRETMSRALSDSNSKNRAYIDSGGYVRLDTNPPSLIHPALSGAFEIDIQG